MLWDSARSHLTVAAARQDLLSDPFFQQLALLASSQTASSSSQAMPRRTEDIDGEPSDIDGVEDGDDGFFADEDAPEVSDVEEEMIEANANALPDPSEEDAQQPPPAGEPAPSTPTAMTAEDARGYVTLVGSGRVLGRITTWGTSISARCNKHTNCTRPYSFRQLPSGDVLRQWLLDGEPCTTAGQHMALHKRMIPLPPEFSKLHK